MIIITRTRTRIIYVGFKVVGIVDGIDVTFVGTVVGFSNNPSMISS